MRTSLLISAVVIFAMLALLGFLRVVIPFESAFLYLGFALFAGAFLPGVIR